MIQGVEFMNFKFQSDSINTILPNWHTAVKSFFKFQSDSINTTLELGEREATYTTLNSNLILLILPLKRDIVSIYLPLNSNLILLIHFSKVCLHLRCKTLNSNLILLILYVKLDILGLDNIFKFQSDSINTDIRDGIIDPAEALNSNLILLILFKTRRMPIYNYPLNSNLILLIRSYYKIFCYISTTLNSNLILLILNQII